MYNTFNNRMNYYSRLDGMVKAYLKYDKVPTQCICSADVLQLLLMDAAKEDDDVLSKANDKACINVAGCNLELKTSEEYVRGTLHVK